MIVQLCFTVLMAELPEESTTWAVKVYVPAVEGVPEILPVDELSVNPGGRVPTTIE